MRFQARRLQKQRPHVEMLPLIDVTIFLLFFFMLFTTFKTDELGIDVDLPRGATGSPREQPANLVVTVTESGAIYLGDRLVTLSAFTEAARQAAAASPEASVTLRADSQSYWEHAVQVMDAARQAGIYRFAFSIQPRVN